MMTAYIILGTILSLPLLLGLLFRVSPNHLFFSLLAGELLSRTFGEDAELLVKAFLPHSPSGDYIKLAVLFLPVLLTALFLRKSLSRGKTLLNLLPLAATGVVFAAFILPITPEVIQHDVRAVEIGRQLLDSSSMIVGAVVFLQLITLWLLNNEKRMRRRR